MSQCQAKNPTSIWIAGNQPNPQSRLRLFCFPYSGGGALTFRTWVKDLPPEIEVCPVQLPGRENRLKEQPYTELFPLVEILAQVLPFEPLPFAFFGHSMGALIAFELARELRRRNQIEPVHLFISAYRAPQLATPLPHLIDDIPDSMVMEELRLAEGMPEWMLKNERVMQMLLPTIRADMNIVKTYTYSPEEPLNYPISAFGGIEDLLVSQEKIAAWQEQTRSSFKLQMFSGNHFFLNSDRKPLLQALSEAGKMHLIS